MQAARLLNNSNVGLGLAVWLARDSYDYENASQPLRDVISATTLLKSTRQFILSNRMSPVENQVDVLDLVSSRVGTAIHDSIEAAWKENYRISMQRLGYPQRVIDRVVINPTEVKPGDFPVYLEQRASRTIDGVTITGKFDQIINGELNDVKTTSVFTYINQTKNQDYQIQGSIYRWLNPGKITSDVMKIQHVFTDWSSMGLKSISDYPGTKAVEISVQLLSLDETEAWIRRKLREIIANQNLPEPDIIPCSDKELWISDPVFKYYADEKKAAEGGRSTKNFSSYNEAMMHRIQQGKGVIITVPGVPKACRYCPAFDSCTQQKAYQHE